MRSQPCSLGCERSLLSIHLLLGSCGGAALAGVSSSCLGWAELLCSCPPPQALYLAWVLSCSGAVLAGGFPSADLFLDSLCLCSEGFGSCVPRAVPLLCHAPGRTAALQQPGCSSWAASHSLPEGRHKVPALGLQWQPNLWFFTAWMVVPSSSKPRHPDCNPSPQQSFCCSSCRLMPSPVLLGHCPPQGSLRRVVLKGRQGFEIYIQLLELL